MRQPKMCPTESLDQQPVYTARPSFAGLGGDGSVAAPCQAARRREWCTQYNNIEVDAFRYSLKAQLKLSSLSALNDWLAVEGCKTVQYYSCGYVTSCAPVRETLRHCAGSRHVGQEHELLHELIGFPLQRQCKSKD